MADDTVERAIEALLDGAALDRIVDSAGGASTAVPEALTVLDAIARTSLAAIFGPGAARGPSVAATWGDLEIRGEIGRGASGTVYRGWDPKLARPVALKLLTADAGSTEALEEGRLLARLDHRHIVRVFGAAEHNGTAGIWMELLEGETLEEILERDGVFGEVQTLSIGLDLAGALAAVHAAGLLHRDVKARNVMRERGGRVVLMDLGAGRATDETALPGHEAGTPMYMAPEVLTGHAATVRSDIYSLGVLLYRLLTHGYPIEARDLSELRRAHEASKPVALAIARPGIGDAAAAAIEKACRRNAEERYPSAAELEAALGDALKRTLAARTPVPSPMRRRWAEWRRRVFVASGVAALVALAIAGAWQTRPGRAARRSLGLTVPPASPLYFTMNGGLGILNGERLTLLANNPTSASVLAVSSDLGLRTMASSPPWTTGGAFRLDGAPVAAPAVAPNATCCWTDGTTDGAANYSIRMDSTLLAPIGSRPLAPPAVYRFARDWSKPEPLFALDPEGTYAGLAYSAERGTFWVTKLIAADTQIQEWSRDGRRLSTLPRMPSALLLGIAVDPRDGTLWAVREGTFDSTTRLENYDTSGHHLASIDIARPHPYIGTGGTEFEWKSR